MTDLRKMESPCDCVHESSTCDGSASILNPKFFNQLRFYGCPLGPLSSIHSWILERVQTSPLTPTPKNFVSTKEPT